MFIYVRKNPTIRNWKIIVLLFLVNTYKKRLYKLCKFIYQTYITAQGMDKFE